MNHFITGVLPTWETASCQDWQTFSCVNDPALHWELRTWSISWKEFICFVCQTQAQAPRSKFCKRLCFFDMWKKNKKRRERQRQESQWYFRRRASWGLEVLRTQSQSTVVHVRKEMPKGDASWQIYGAKMTSDRPGCSLLVLENAVTHGPQLASEGGIPQIKSPWSGAHPWLWTPGKADLSVIPWWSGFRGTDVNVRTLMRRGRCERIKGNMSSLPRTPSRTGGILTLTTTMKWISKLSGERRKGRGREWGPGLTSGHLDLTTELTALLRSWRLITIPVSFLWIIMAKRWLSGLPPSIIQVGLCLLSFQIKLSNTDMVSLDWSWFTF